LVFALVDSGARILAEGIALRASDIDVVYLSGYGFPRHRGGPMWYADSVGLATVLDSLRTYHGDDGWSPADLLVRLAAEQGTFNQRTAVVSRVRMTRRRGGHHHLRPGGGRRRAPVPVGLWLPVAWQTRTVVRSMSTPCPVSLRGSAGRRRPARGWRTGDAS
ncbi:MAG TPA: hypothetical protein VHV49_03990, partial [Pseudonocardiaceae bacterium]|nr:hypothetical protein [Pseudonocardiaceae bacterium]